MRITKRTPLLLAASVATALALAACGGEPTTVPPSDSAGGDGGTAPLLTVGTFAEPTSWDPAQANEGNLAPLYQAVYDTLVKREPNGELTPMLATSWEASEDGLTWTFDLRDDVTFTDGAAFDAAAAVANLEHFRSANGPFASALASVESVEATDDYTLQITLSAPNPDLAYALGSAAGYMGSPDALGTDGITTDPVGSGPYVLDTANTVTGSKIAFDRNEDYWGEALPFDEVEFQILTDETARLNALKTGQVMAAKLNTPSAAIDAKNSGFADDEDTVNWEGIIFFDRDGVKVPELADVRVREALAIAIDREAIVEATSLGRAVTTSQTFGPNTEGFQEDLENAYEYDPERARDLLAEAGAENLTLTLPMSAVFPQEIYNAIIQGWQDIGVTVETHQWGPGEAIPQMLRGDWPVAFMSLAQQPDWTNIRFEVAPDATWNALRTETDELNSLIEEYQYGDESSRPGAAEEINTYLVENFWFAPMSRTFNNFFYDEDQVLVEPQAAQAQPSIYNFTPAD